MADPRTFTLIGEFKDGITSELERINRQLATLKTSFSKLGGKGARGAARDMGRFSAAVSSLSDNLKLQNQALAASIGPLRAYRTEIGKTVSAFRHLNAAGGNTRGLEATNRALKEQIRLMGQAQAQSARMKGMGGGRGGGGGGGGGNRGGGGGGNRGGGGGGGGQGPGGFHMAEFGFAYTLGNAIATPIQTAVAKGFEIGIGMMTKPFQYFADSFGERVKDELSDLKAAGGLFSISKRSANPFLKDIDDAIQYQQETNETFAKMAASLPGVTNDYVQVGKRLSDTAARIVATDFTKARAEANKIRATEEGQKFYGGQIVGTGAEQQKETIKTLLGELTKKTTIAGLGGKSGAGGVAGAYGLPGLTERMLSQQEVTMGQFQRYAAVFSDPTISDALQRNINNINASQMNSVDRFKAISKLLDEIVTPQLIEKLRISVDGVYQGFKAAFLDPDTGLFGLGRNFQKFGKKINAYGQYVDAAGKAVDDITLAADEDLSIFEIVRDVFSNVGQVLLPLTDSLKLIFDPLKSVANILMDARHYAAEFNSSFNQYREGLKILSGQKGNEFLKGTLDVRASFLAITNLLKQFGAIGSGDFQSFSTQITGKDFEKNIGKILTEILDKLLNSDIAKNIGEMIGEIVGTVLAQVAGVTGFISGRVAGSNKLFDGIKKGFESSGGVEAIGNIFADVFKTLFSILGKVMQMIPFEGYIMIGAMTAIPALAQGIGMAIAQGITGSMGNLNKEIKSGVASSVVGSGGRGGRGGMASFFAAPGNERFLRRKTRGARKAGRGFFGTTGYTSEIGPTPRGRAGEAIAGGYMPSGLKAGRGAAALKGLAERTKGIRNVVPGGALAGGALDLGMSMASGENFGKAAAGALGTVLGGVVGSAFGPVGTMIGMTAGGMIADAGLNLVTSGFKQNSAADTQLQAARQQLEASRKKLGELGVDVGAAGAGVGDPMKLEQVLNMMKLRGNALAEQYLDQTAKLRGLADVTKVAGDELNKQIAFYKERGFTSDQIASLPSVKKLQAEYSALEGKTKVAGDALKTTFAKMPEMMQSGIATAMTKMDTSVIANAIANKVNMTQVQLPPPMWTFPGAPPPPGLGRGGVKYPASLSAFSYKGSLGDAVASEMKHKPSGSNLVIANSSETVIPAAGGHGMLDFVKTLRSGFGSVVSTLRTVNMGSASSNSFGGFGSGVNVTNNITINQQSGQNADELASIVALKIGEAVADARASSIFV